MQKIFLSHFYSLKQLWYGWRSKLRFSLLLVPCHRLISHNNLAFYGIALAKVTTRDLNYIIDSIFSRNNFQLALTCQSILRVENAQVSTVAVISSNILYFYLLKLFTFSACSKFFFRAASIESANILPTKPAVCTSAVRAPSGLILATFN